MVVCFIQFYLASTLMQEERVIKLYIHAQPVGYSVQNVQKYDIINMNTSIRFSKIEIIMNITR